MKHPLLIAVVLVPLSLVVVGGDGVAVKELPRTFVSILGSGLEGTRTLTCYPVLGALP